MHQGAWVCDQRVLIGQFCFLDMIITLMPEEVQQGQKVTISQSRAPILLYGSTGFIAVPCNKSVLYMFSPYLILVRALYPS